LANLLINEPDILILDEPTNHLDLDIIVWLEDFLYDSNSTLLMVTHDRYFLDRICNEILELDDKTLYNIKEITPTFLKNVMNELKFKMLKLKKPETYYEPNLSG